MGEVQARGGQAERGRVMVGWLVLLTGLLALILVPFALLEAPLSAAVGGRLDGDNGMLLTVAMVIGALVADILLPIPSSIVSVAAGALLGWLGGTLAVTAGMMLGAGVGYGLGRTVGPLLLPRILPVGEQQRLFRLVGRHGAWMVAGLRAVPVLAEASVIVAGMAGVPLSRLMPACLASSLGVALLYAGAGALTAPWFGDALLFPAAFVVALLPPSLAWFVSRLIRKSPE